MNNAMTNNFVVFNIYQIRAVAVECQKIFFKAFVLIL